MRFRIFAFSLIGFAMASSCGPSLRRTQQSDHAFARCFDMDYNPGARRRHKTKCWNTWLGEHVYNQPEDKTAYAKLRLDELSKGISIPGPPGNPGSFTKRPVPEKSPAKPKPKSPEPEPVAPAEAVPSPATPNATNPSVSDPAPVSPETEACEQRCKDENTDCNAKCGEESDPASGCSKACIELTTNCLNKCLT